MLDAVYFDGKTTRKHPARVEFHGDRIALELEGGRRDETMDRVILSERLEAAPRTATFRDGSYLEIQQTPELDAALLAVGHRMAAVERWQVSVPVALGCLAVLLALAALGYQYGLRSLAEFAAKRLPDSAVEQLSRKALAQADDGLLEPSSLLTRRRDALRTRFLELRPPDGTAAKAMLLFRGSPTFGANAVALPDGTIVLTDELVRLADHDDQVIAVLAHELGHVHYRHGMRKLLQGTVVSAVMAAWVGDVTALAATAPATLIKTSFSREFELEADAYAAQLLKARGLSPSLLAQMLNNLELNVHGVHADQREKDTVGGFLATHPSSQERIEALKKLE